jgi:thymidylate synthase (FAD)
MVFNDSVLESKVGYASLILIDVLKEDARYVLPNACCTDIYMSCNLRELIHICNERLCSRAQWEIREVVQKMVNLVDPELKFMLVPKCKSGRIICHTPCEMKGETQNEK